MKRFLIITSAMMVLVLALAVVTFVYVQMALAPESTTDEEVPVAPATTEPGVAVPASQNATPDTVTDDTPVRPGDEAPASEPESAPPVPEVTKPIPLSSLPLTDTQKDLLRGAGIDPETFVITPEMITCAQERLGAARFAKIVAGDAPGPTEVFSLLRCL